MKILIINYEYPPLGGGGGVTTRILAEELITRGHQIHVLTSKIRKQKTKEVINGVKIYRVPVFGRKDGQSASMLSLFTWPLFSIPVGLFFAIKHRYDLINTHFFAPTGPTGMIVSLLTFIPNTIFAHGGDVYDPSRINLTPSGKGLMANLLKLSLKIQSKLAKGVMCQSNDTKDRIEKLLPLNHKPIKVIALPYKQPELILTKSTKSTDNFTLISIGRLVERKGYNYLIQALPSLPSNIRLQILGDGPQLETLKELAKNLRVEERISFKGFVSEQEKYQLLKNADCYVLSSLHEAMGVVIQEAMQVGLPIVSTNIGGQNDLLKNDENAIMVGPKDADQLAKAILKLYNDRGMCTKLQNNNLEKIKEFYVKTIVKQFEEYFKTIVNHG